jgi:hypothetical protein
VGGNVNGDGKDSAQHNHLEFVYPYGCTLALEEPAVPLLSTGSVCYPTKVCIAAISTDMTPSAKRARGMPQVHGGVSKGRVMVVGSVQMFGDGWIDKEENTSVMRCADVCCAGVCCDVWSDVCCAVDRHYSFHNSSL